MARETLCFTCGQPVAGDLFENRLPTGEACPACRARLLDEAPSLLPGAQAPQQLEMFEPQLVSRDDDGPPDDPMPA